MAGPLLTEELWRIAEPILPPVPEQPKGGRPWVPNRQALTGIIFILRTGLNWNLLPKEMRCGSGSTCFRRFKVWTAAGVWRELHLATLRELGREGRIAWWYAVIDSASVRALAGGPTPDPARSTGPKGAANATSFATPMASRW
jgi:transposase